MYLPGPMTGLGNGLLTGTSTIGIPPPPIVASATPGLPGLSLLRPGLEHELRAEMPGDRSVAEAYARAANNDVNGAAPFPWGKVLFWGAVGVGVLWAGSKLLKPKPVRTNRRRRRRRSASYRYGGRRPGERFSAWAKRKGIAL